jgi:hypothetical protein
MNNFMSTIKTYNLDFFCTAVLLEHMPHPSGEPATPPAAPRFALLTWLFCGCLEMCLSAGSTLPRQQKLFPSRHFAGLQRRGDVVIDGRVAAEAQQRAEAQQHVTPAGIQGLADM